GIITFDNGSKGVVEANTITKPRNLGYQLAIFGEKGSICIGGKGFDEVEHCYLEGYTAIEQELKLLESERMNMTACIKIFSKQFPKIKNYLLPPEKERRL